ncbi:Acyl transferase/acyl hydrolase/lysophospholipase [Penicillium verhagenii]|uniref:Acyl transferase/acyl hydrolase/lysophospholipase n=1 Tax=Penicillium verhagenii TaxID=1562060 RepID=UPI002544D534|nr:Acyl transferase/acyl hydrolase/lysophospholipase [Penicillium verhagenii]KAJ5930964.1 Acyl transferase/acyl hydrolase/lysophospholipase [Penicillium verhagenii]
MHYMGLNIRRIFSSKDVSFKLDLLCATAGRGVDVVLNSLSGELLHASWECVAEFGRMIELEKRDFLNHGKLEMSAFQVNRAFFRIDIGSAMEANPEFLNRLVEP